MSSHDRQTLTFLFTDIESSTQKWQREPEAMAVALRDHDALLAVAVESHGGRLFKNTGDGVCAAFDSVTGAIAAAEHAQGSLELPVRMGLHTGEAEARDGDFFGPTLNRCARIMEAGHGGQILLSDATRGLVSDLVAKDLGERVLKGLDRPERIHQLGTASFPPLRTGQRPVSMPHPTTSLIGRQALIEEIIDRFSTARVVTLTGAGGVGKTRVALAVANRMVVSYDRTAFVDLSAVHDDAEVLSALARALDVSTSSMDSISIALSDRSTLIVLDNCEHVLDATAELVEALMEISRQVEVLATSREGLAVHGEYIVAVPGLKLEDEGEGSTAVDLFVDRAQSLDALFAPNAEELEIISDICRHLDGLPLALELAAARVGVLSPAGLRSRLGERFQLLTGGRRRRGRDRQRTLRETVDWSYDLLAADEREAFASLAVFAGSFGLDSAAAVMPGRSEVEVLDLLEALIDKSLLTSVNPDGLRRYRYLETIRSYAEERLEDLGESSSTMARLSDHLVEVVADTVDDVFNGSGIGPDRLRAEVPNLRRSFDYALGGADHELAASLIGPLAELFALVDWPISGWADEALALPGVTATSSEPRLLAVQAVDHWLRGRFDLLGSDGDRMLEAARAFGSVPDVVGYVAATAYRYVANDLVSRRILRSRLERLRAQDDGRAEFTALTLASLEQTPPNPGAESGALDPELERSLASAADHSSPVVRAQAAQVTATRAHVMGDFEHALELSDTAIELNVVGSGHWFGSLNQRALAELSLGRIADAVATADLVLDHAHRVGDRSATILPVVIYAMALRDGEEAAVVGILRGFLPRRLTVMMISELAELDRWLDERISPTQRTELAATGASMTARELQDLAHTTLAPHIKV